MICKIIAGALILALLPQPSATVCALGLRPTHRRYLGIVYREPDAGVVGLADNAGGYLAWFVRVGPPYGLNIVGGFRSRRTITLAQAAGGAFLLAMPNKSGTRIDTYDPHLDKVTSSMTVNGVKLATGVWNSLQTGAGGHLWMLGVAGHAVYLNCVDSDHGQLVGRFKVPSGANGVLFWPSERGALVGVADHPDPGAEIRSLFYVTPDGMGHRDSIPRRLRPFPALATVRRRVLFGVNARWQFIKANIGPRGRIQPVIVKKLGVNRKLISRPAYYFHLGEGRAVLSALGDWHDDRYLHRYLFLISEKSGRVLRKAIIPAACQPISAAGGSVYILEGNKIVEFNSQLHPSLAASDAAPTPWAIQGAASR